MARALFVARRGLGRTTPNPQVGAVVVSPDGIVVAQGAHLVAGGPHAEVVALDEAGSRARGATLYCSLEPCAHHGRTGPCVERIVAAGIRRVVAATTDINPRVAGQGLAYLEAHGVETTTGVGRDEALEQHAPFFTWITQGRPFVTLKTAISADGYVGSRAERVFLTGAPANRFFQRQRAGIDAIAVGAGTILVDDPLLTARGAYRFRPLTRVIFDWRGRVPPSARVFAGVDADPVIMVVSAAAVEAAPARFGALAARGVTIEPATSRALRPVLQRLAASNVVSLLVEGGPALHQAFADEGLADRLQLVSVPRTLGGGVRAAPVFGALTRAGSTGRRIGDDWLRESSCSLG
jgi:diaminohydroxyphosphoribosylaminopyrimidine deaminase/5-amino-6-(5-phosphoribosylamino)uracil reductase